MGLQKNGFSNSLRKIAAMTAYLCLVSASLIFISQTACAQEGQTMDKRKLTTIQTAAVGVGDKKNAVEVRYLNLPFGAATFGYMEKGGNRFYSNRTWPIAHLKLATTATYEGKKLAPGDYVFIITPKSETFKTETMTLSLASFKPETEGGTFLKPGDVFTTTPKDVTVISQKPVTFASGAPLNENLKIALEKTGETVAINIHYGDRTLTEKLMLK